VKQLIVPALLSVLCLPARATPPGLDVQVVRPFTAAVHGMAFAPDGTLYYSDTFANQGPVARVYTLAPPLSGAPQATAITGSTVSGLLWNGGELYVCVTGANQVRRYSAALQLQQTWTVAQPWNVERIGGVLLAVTNGGQVVRLNANGTTTSLVSGLLAPFDISADGSTGFWVSEQVGGAPPGKVRHYDASGQALGVADFPWDNPEGLEIDVAGRLYVADTGAGTVRRVLSGGTIELVTDQFTLPIVITRHPDGNLYFNTAGPTPQLVRIVLAPPGGRTPDTLAIRRLTNGNIRLTWEPSCSPSDLDYAVYDGPLASFAAKAPLLCSTAGATVASFAPPAGDVFFLVVPHNGVIEGSYGLDSDGLERPPSPAACFPQAVSGCD
jgi:hypothetical protein